MNKSIISRVFERRVNMLAAAYDLRDAARAEVAALEAKLAEAKAELSRAELLVSRNHSRCYRAHVELHAGIDMRERLRIIDTMAQDARENQAHLRDLQTLVMA